MLLTIHPEICESDINGLALNLGIVAFCLPDVGTTEVGAEATSLPMIATCDDECIPNRVTMAVQHSFTGPERFEGIFKKANADQSALQGECALLYLDIKYYQ